MPVSLSQSLSATLDNRSYDSQLAVSADAGTTVDKTLPVAKNGVLTTRTDANTGSLTMDAGHGITTGARLDIYWLDTDGISWLCQRGVTAGTVATNVVPIDLGVGTDLPVATTAVTVGIVQSEVVSVVRDNMVGVGAQVDTQGTIVFAAADNTELYAYTNPGPGGGVSWLTGSGTNPLTSGTTVGKVFMSNGNVSNTANGRVTMAWN